MAEISNDLFMEVLNSFRRQVEHGNQKAELVFFYFLKKMEEGKLPEHHVRKIISDDDLLGSYIDIVSERRAISLAATDQSSDLAGELKILFEDLAKNLGQRLDEQDKKIDTILASNTNVRETLGELRKSGSFRNAVAAGVVSSVLVSSAWSFYVQPYIDHMAIVRRDPSGNSPMPVRPGRRDNEQGPWPPQEAIIPQAPAITNRRPK